MLYLYQHSVGGRPFYVGIGTLARARKVRRKDNPRHAAAAQWADPESRARKVAGMSGCRWITDGESSAKLWAGERMPPGWRFGRPRAGVMSGPTG